MLNWHFICRLKLLILRVNKDKGVWSLLNLLRLLSFHQSCWKCPCLFPRLLLVSNKNCTTVKQSSVFFYIKPLNILSQAKGGKIAAVFNRTKITYFLSSTENLSKRSLNSKLSYCICEILGISYKAIGKNKAKIYAKSKKCQLTLQIPQTHWRQ